MRSTKSKVIKLRRKINDIINASKDIVDMADAICSDAAAARMRIHQLNDAIAFKSEHKNSTYIISYDDEAYRWLAMRSNGCEIISSWIEGGDVPQDIRELEILRAETFIAYYPIKDDAMRFRAVALMQGGIDIGIRLSAKLPVLFIGELGDFPFLRDHPLVVHLDVMPPLKKKVEEQNEP